MERIDYHPEPQRERRAANRHCSQRRRFEPHDKERACFAGTGPAKLTAHLAGDALTGNLLQGGNSAPFTLHKTGPPQVDEVARSTPVGSEFEGEWKGEYELFGYKRHVSLKLFNHEGTGATADFVVVGKRVNNLPVDLVTQEGDFLTVDSHETGLSYEGRFVRNANELTGVIIQGGIETPLVLHRSK